MTKKLELEMKRYEEQGFDDWQLYEIRKGLEEGVDVTKYADSKLTDEEMAEIRKELTNENLEKNQVSEIEEKHTNKDININFDYFNIGQQKQIEWGLESGINVKEYADPKLDSYQMQEKRWKLEKQKEAELEPEIGI